MKKLVLLFSVVLMTLGLNAQNFYFGGAFTGKSTWLLNKAVFDRGASQDIGASFGSDFGLIGGIGFNDYKVGIEINLLFNSFSQKYEGTKDPDAFIGSDYTSKSVYKSTDIPILFKTGSESAYFEIGPVFSFINKATFEMDYDDARITDMKPTSDISAYNTTSVGAILGFGGNIDVSDNLKITLGLRFYYGITDIGGVNALGWDSKSTKDMDDLYQLSHPTKDNHFGHNDFKTNPLSGGLKIGLIYVIEN